MDEYYTLKFFAYADFGRYIVEDLQEFACPQHYDTIDDARFVAEYWMSYGFFRSVRCDKRVESLDVSLPSTSEFAFYGQKLDGEIVWKERTGDVTYTEMTHSVVWRGEPWMTNR